MRSNADNGGYVTRFNNIVVTNELGVINLFNKSLEGVLGSDFDNIFRFINSLIYIPIHDDIFNFGTHHLKIDGGSWLPGQTSTVNFTSVPASYMTTNNYTGFFMGCRYFRGALTYYDYEPYRSISAYLPYFGYVDLPIKDIDNKWVTFVLKIDYMSGQGTYIIYVTDNEQTPYLNYYFNPNTITNGYVLGEYCCYLGVDIPLSYSGAADRKRDLIMGLTETTANLALLTVTKGMPISTTKTVKSTGNVTKKQYKRAGANGKIKYMGRTVTSFDDDITTRTTYNNTEYSMINECFNSAKDALTNTVGRANTYKSQNVSLNITNTNDIIIVERRANILAVGTQFNHLFGRPLGVVKKLSDLSGYTEISNIHLDDAGFEYATQDEKSLIEEALSHGFII